jgi:tRNA pseudouridine32 synthase/23S rRNA pseudouridine746 synthase
VGASQVFCPQGGWRTVFEFLCQRFIFVSTEEWACRFESSSIFDAQGQALNLDSPYTALSPVYYFRTVAQEPVLPYEETVLYQDENLVVADKPHFLPVVPSGPYVQETLLVRLKQKLGLADLVPLHRIDRDTAGIVMFSIQKSQRAAYHALFRDGKITKTYQAIAPFRAELNALPKPIAVINRLETADNFMQMRVVQGAPNSHTDVLAIEQLLTKPELARYTLRPHTGKRHQLRVHMLGLGAPLMGDGIYPSFLPERDITSIGHTPLQLLAQTLEFIDPFSGQLRQFESQRDLSL